VAPRHSTWPAYFNKNKIWKTNIIILRREVINRGCVKRERHTMKVFSAVLTLIIVVTFSCPTDGEVSTKMLNRLFFGQSFFKPWRIYGIPNCTTTADKAGLKVKGISRICETLIPPNRNPFCVFNSTSSRMSCRRIRIKACMTTFEFFRQIIRLSFRKNGREWMVMRNYDIAKDLQLLEELG